MNDVLSSGAVSAVRRSPLYLLILDASDQVRECCYAVALKHKFVVSEARDPLEARKLLKKQAVNILIMDLKCRTEQGHLFVDELKALHPDIEIIAIVSEHDAASVDTIWSRGVQDYVMKPIDRGRLLNVLERTRQHIAEANRRRRLHARSSFLQEKALLAGQSDFARRLRRFIANAGTASHPILICGESGSGKRFVARAIHVTSRKEEPFAKMDCASLSPRLHGSELFGHIRGAFRGADRDELGILVAAESGTVLLENVDALSYEMQSALMQVLRSKEVQPIGSHKMLPLTARIIAATACDISQMVKFGAFRKDLFTFLNIAGITLEPLRRRSEDLPSILDDLLERRSRRAFQRHTVPEHVLAEILRYSWPGNFTEFENSIEFACTRSPDSSLQLRDFPFLLEPRSPWKLTPSDQPASVPRHGAESHDHSIAALEKQAILKAIEATKGDKRAAAQRLGIGKTTLYRKLKEYGIAL